MPVIDDPTPRPRHRGLMLGIDRRRVEPAAMRPISRGGKRGPSFEVIRNQAFALLALILVACVIGWVR